MKDSLNQLQDSVGNAWQGLEERDKKTLMLAVPVILLLVLYLLVFQPIYGRYTDARDHHQQLSETLIGLYESAPLIERVQNGCSRQRLIEAGDKSVMDFAKDVGRRAGMAPEIRANGNADFSVQINKAAGNRALAALQSYVCHGFVVRDLRLNRATETATDVSMTFTLSAAGFLLQRQGN